MEQPNNASFSLGLICILAGLLVNETTLEQLLVHDGEIADLTLRYTIIAQQLVLICIGLFLLINRPFIASSTFRDCLTNSVLCLTSFVISLIIAELFLRMIIPLNSDQDLQYRIPHPELGWTLKPNTSHIRHRLRKNIKVSYNAKGWRDIEHQIQKPEGVFRILVLGDSYMEAYTVEFEQSFAYRLQLNAKNAGYDVEVINMGVGGYGTLQEYLVFEQFGKQYSPDLVLLAFYTMNDLRDNSLELSNLDTHPHLDSKQPDQWQIIPADFELIQQRFLEAEKRYKTKASNWTRQSALYQLIKRIRSQPKQTKYEILGSNAIGVSHCQDQPAYSRAWITTERILTRLKNQVEKIGSELIVFTVPAIMEVDPDHMLQALSFTTNPEMFCLEQAPGNLHLSQILSKLDVELIDLLPDFRKNFREHDVQLFPLDDGHWNAAGHALAAQRILSELEQQYVFAIQSNQ